MCGITGIYNLQQNPPPEKEYLLDMLGMIHHRGPDEFGLYSDAQVGIANTRLSILDLRGGSQPIGNEDGSLWIVLNGEIFNYIELRLDLERKGHAFTTSSDTEVVLHLYEELGPHCLNQLNGQFALAIWDVKKKELFLARDRVGICPLFYALHNGRLLFGSEIKALLAYPGLQAEIDTQALVQVFTYWSVLPPNTIFRGIQILPPAHYLLAREGEIHLQSYWEMDFTEEAVPQCSSAEYRRWETNKIEEFENLLMDAIRVRLRADVPVGAYLSGGLDSSLLCAMIRSHFNNAIETFSIAFEDSDFDESRYQRCMAEHLGTRHHTKLAHRQDIGSIFPQVVYHAETPLLRTAPAPMYLLSELVQESQFKVVVTGEGADEFLAGYDIFKEAKVRRFWAKNPQSTIRPKLLWRLYSDIAPLKSSGEAYLKAFFGNGLSDTASPYYSHAIRWGNTMRTHRFLAIPSDTKSNSFSIELPEKFSWWSSLAQAQYLEIMTFLSPYLLAAQGDRMIMAHSVEGRYPFLDHRVIEFCNRLPSNMKLRTLKEKWLLKQLGQRYVPQEILHRQKHPYRAPIRSSFYPGENRPSYVKELISKEAIENSGIFIPAAVSQLMRKAESGFRLSETDEMALTGILSTQLLLHFFVFEFRKIPLPKSAKIKTIDGKEESHDKR